MPKIHVLPDILASQVAAGEVVERPASVVKELVENSLDAGATEIEVSISQGGIHFMKIRDNGCGMSREDALLSLERHATSKLRDAKDLMAISTLGFRGEAIPSIASVSRFRLLTCERDQPVGTEIRLTGGKIDHVREAASPAGTTFEIENLFFNVPARRKFLRAESTESAHVDQQLRLHALAAPHVRFLFQKDQSLVFDLSPCRSHADRVRQLLGEQTRALLLEIPIYEHLGFRVFGALLPAAHARKGRRHQCLFLNGRPIEDPLISRAIREGFRNSIPEGLHPAAWLWIEMSPYAVDVNVHPAKKEVRFQRPHEVRNAVTEALLAMWRAHEAAAQHAQTKASVAQHFSKISTPPAHQPSKSSDKAEFSPPPAAIPATLSPAKNPFHQAQQQHFLPPTPTTKRAPSFQFLSMLLNRYALLESADSLVLLDPRAAHERILYEELLSEKSHGVATQPLLVPEILELEPRDHELLLREKNGFLQCGLDLDAFGSQTLQISSIPACLQHLKTRDWLHDWIDEILHASAPQGRFVFERLAKALAKRAARTIVVHSEEIPALLDRLFDCDLPYCTADGRPTLSELSLAELQKRFGQK